MSSFATDKGAQASLERRHKLDVDQLRRDFLAVLQTGEGRRVLWHVIDTLSGLHGWSINGDPSTFFNEGRRSVGGRLRMQLMEASRELYVQMTEEALRASVSREALKTESDSRRELE